MDPAALSPSWFMTGFIQCRSCAMIGWKAPVRNTRGQLITKTGFWPSLVIGFATSVDKDEGFCHQNFSPLSTCYSCPHRWPSSGKEASISEFIIMAAIAQLSSLDIASLDAVTAPSAPLATQLAFRLSSSPLPASDSKFWSLDNHLKYVMF